MSAPRTSLAHEHELHRRKRGLNMGLGLVLGAFVVLVFVLTFVKVTQQDVAFPRDLPGSDAGPGSGADAPPAAPASGG